MDYLKQLDDVLGFLDDGDRPGTVYLSIKRTFKEIHDNHLYMILDKLMDDRYVIYQEGSKSRYSITYDGLMFLGSGGYSEQYRIDQRAIRKSVMVDYGIIFAGIGASLSALYLFGSALIDWIYPCCY